MSRTPLLDRLYKPRSWKQLDSALKLDTELSGLDVFSPDSHAAQIAEHLLQKRVDAGEEPRLDSDIFLVEWELMAADADVPLTAGARVEKLASNQHGLPAGTIIMNAYDMDGEHVVVHRYAAI